jgi:hypothetical protein
MRDVANQVRWSRKNRGPEAHPYISAIIAPAVVRNNRHVTSHSETLDDGPKLAPGNDSSKTTAA